MWSYLTSAFTSSNPTETINQGKEAQTKEAQTKEAQPKEAQPIHETTEKIIQEAIIELDASEADTSEADASEADTSEADTSEADTSEADASQCSESSDEQEPMYNTDFCHTIMLKDYITRILIFGTKNNKYSSNVKELDAECKIYLENQIQAGNGFEILDCVKDIYKNDRAPKQDTTLMVHAMLCRAEDEKLRVASLEFLKKYRTISQLYTWKSYHAKIGGSKGFGRAVKRNLNEWILNKEPQELAYQFTKYIHRGDWGISDFLKCIHTKTGTGDDRASVEGAGASAVGPSIKKSKTHLNLPATPIDLVLRYVVDGYEAMEKLAQKYNLIMDKTYQYLRAVELAKTNALLDEDSVAGLIQLIYKFRLTREQVPTNGLAIGNVLKALLCDENKTKILMPLTALLRNLANMSRLDVFEDMDILCILTNHLTNKDIITKARIHPVSVLTAWFTYRAGSSKKSKHTWDPIPAIIDALEEMFYLSFANVAPMDKKLCFLIDCSGSMSSESLCEGVSNAAAAALLAMIFARGTNKNKHAFYLFSSGDEDSGLVNVSDVIHDNAKFEEVLNAVQRSDWASTDISKGILFAKQQKIAYDGFVVITDNDVNSGIKPSIALQEYRNEMQIKAKLAVIATQLSDYSIADPLDKGMIDFCGFDSYSPKILHDFFTGLTVSELDEIDE